MRVLLTDTHFLQKGWSNSLRSLGHEVILWNQKTKPAFDIFNEFEPDILIAQSSDINRSLFKCIINNKETLKTFFWLKNWSDHMDWAHKYPEYTASPEEKETVLYINKELPLIGLAPYLEHWTCNTHLSWIENKIEIRSSLPAASVEEGKVCPEFICDLTYYGNQVPDMNEFLIPLLQNRELNVKIFSENPYWTEANCLGYLRGERLADLYATATLSLCLLPHGTGACWHIDETIFNILASGGTPVVRPNSTIQEIFKNTSAVFINNRAELISLLQIELSRGSKVPTYVDRVKVALPEVL